MANAEDNKASIAELQDAVNKFKVRKLPAHTPPLYSSTTTKVSFLAWSNSVKAYLLTKAVNDDLSMVSCLLTFLDAESYHRLCLAHSPEDIVKLSFTKAVETIGAAIEETHTEVGSLCKLRNLQQGNLTLREFIERIHKYAQIAFPKTESKSSKEQVMLSTLLAGIKNKSLGFEIYKIRKSEQNEDRTFEYLCKIMFIPRQVII